jgi:hypothetical protein
MSIDYKNPGKVSRKVTRSHDLRLNEKVESVFAIVSEVENPLIYLAGNIVDFMEIDCYVKSQLLFLVFYFSFGFFLLIVL